MFETFDAMLNAGMNAVCDRWNYQDGARSFYKSYHKSDYVKFLVGALSYLAEHPVVPTREEAEMLAHAFTPETADEVPEMLRAVVKAWQSNTFSQIS